MMGNAVIAYSSSLQILKLVPSWAWAFLSIPCGFYRHPHIWLNTPLSLWDHGSIWCSFVNRCPLKTWTNALFALKYCFPAQKGPDHRVHSHQHIHIQWLVHSFHLHSDGCFLCRLGFLGMFPALEIWEHHGMLSESGQGSLQAQTQVCDFSFSASDLKSWNPLLRLHWGLLPESLWGAQRNVFGKQSTTVPFKAPNLL